MADREHLVKEARALSAQRAVFYVEIRGNFNANASVAIREIIEDYPRIYEELHPICSQNDCDWQLECVHKAKFGKTPDICPYRT